MATRCHRRRRHLRRRQRHTWRRPAELAANHDLVLDYWTRTYLHPRYYHRQRVFHADGSSTTNDLGDVTATEDPALARQKAIEAAERAGILGKQAGSGSGK